jgi:hypothetical protein
MIYYLNFCLFIKRKIYIAHSLLIGKKEGIFMKINKPTILFILSVMLISSAYAAITATIQSPSAGWNNNYAILLNVTVNDNANITFNTTVYSTLTTLATNATQGSLTLNSTYLNEGNNTIYVYATNASDTDTQNVANVAVDVSTPTWLQTPTNQTLVYNTALAYDINATDAGIGIDTYFVNNTGNFSINASGMLTNATFLSAGNYSLNISVNDSLNHILSQPIIITVSACVENWTCSSWSSCSGSTQTRTCTDNNSCGTTNDRPALSQSCSSGGGGGGSSSKECRDNRDNDGDGLIDYPDDPGCSSSYDDDETNEECIENWYCGSWTDCIDNQQTRTCEDWNTCGATTLKPAETRECTVEIIEEPVLEEEPEQPAVSPITGAVVVEEGPLSAGNILIKSLAIIAFSAAMAFVITKMVMKKK